MHEIKLQNRTVSYTLRKSKRARKIRIAVYPDGRVVLTTPFLMPEFIAKKFAQSKAAWIFSKLDYFKKHISYTLPRSTKADYLKYKKNAYDLVQELILKFNAYYKFHYNNITIKNQKTRWGSCSTKRNLNFNYKIVLLSKPLAEYIVVHELCHLQEFNHSQKFWNLVSKTIPNYKELCKELKKGGLSLG